jgi:hypothetical protein
MPTAPFFRASQTSLFSPQPARTPALLVDLLAEFQFPDGRIFELQLLSVRPADGFSCVCVAEVEVKETTYWFHRYFHVYVYWEELVGHDLPPSPESVALIARREVGDWLHNYRNWPDDSNGEYATPIHFPPRKPLPYFP